MLTQKEFLSNLLRRNPNAVICASLGTISYDLAEIPHRNKILIKGNMGGIMGVALGYALSNKKQILCIVGDGSFLMKMGSVSTIMAYKPKNLKVYIMVNGKYASTGGQKINKIIPLPPKSHFSVINTL
jgi:phosphonopyruvate decarboxylase